MRPATAIVACAIALLAGGALRAQEPAVITQTVTIDGRAVTEPGVLELVETRPGKPFSQADVHESIAHLVGLGRFEDVVVSRDVVPGGIALTYTLIPSRVVRSIAFKGDVGLPDRDLHDRIKEHFGNTPSLARLPDLLDVPQDRLSRRRLRVTEAHGASCARGRGARRARHRRRRGLAPAHSAHPGRRQHARRARVDSVEAAADDR